MHKMAASMVWEESNLSFPSRRSVFGLLKNVTPISLLFFVLILPSAGRAKFVTNHLVQKGTTEPYLLMSL
jgi:hypothetical protein